MAKLLLIDDEGVVLGALKAVLIQKGHVVSTAASGPEGLALLAADAPDLIILDRDLPGMTGSAVLREIRKLNREVGVIILSGNTEAPGEQKYRALGISAFLPKDMNIEAFLKAVEIALAKTARGQEVPPKAAAPLILVADDDLNVQSVLRRFLEEKGYRVETAGNGNEALEALEKLRPCLILLDIAMPLMNGLDTLKRIRESGNDVAVMMITGNKDLEIARECMKLGACDYIVKPLDFDYLELSVLAKILISTP
jgi:CheY-like chemotaxis protein